MNFKNPTRLTRSLGLRIFVLSVVCAWSGLGNAALPDALQPELNSALDKLSVWAADPAVVAAVKRANASPASGMDNGKWVELGDNAPQVLAITSTPVSQQMGQWMAGSGLNKLFLRSQNGSLVAGPKKPLVYNVKKRPPFKNGIKGAPWHGKKIKPDPSTEIKSVQISVPVKDGDSVIGVLHSAMTVR